MYGNGGTAALVFNFGTWLELNAQLHTPAHFLRRWGSQVPLEYENSWMFCWPCTIAYQHSETNVMNFLFNLLRIKNIYMFRALLTHPQEAIHTWRLVYCLSVILVGRTKCRLCSTFWGWASNARNVQRPLILNKLNKMCITFVSLYWWD
jgi:hypothetical protein